MMDHGYIISGVPNYSKIDKIRFSLNLTGEIKFNCEIHCSGTSMHEFLYEHETSISASVIHLNNKL